MFYKFLIIICLHIKHIISLFILEQKYCHFQMYRQFTSIVFYLFFLPLSLDINFLKLNLQYNIKVATRARPTQLEHTEVIKRLD